MGNLMTKRLSEKLREEKRNLNRSIREIEREIYKLENEKGQIEKNIKAYAKKNEMDLVRTLAKDFVKIRQTIAKYRNIKSHLFSMKIKLQTVHSSEQLNKSVKELNEILKRVNRYIKLNDLNVSVNEFQKQTNEADLKEDMLNDLFDTVNYDVNLAEAEDEVVAKVLDELGIEVNAKLTQIPDVNITNNNALKEQEEEEAKKENANMNDLEARINNLKKM